MEAVKAKRKTRGRKAMRESIVDIYNETIALRKHKKLLGQEVEIDDALEWRVRWGQRGMGVFGLITLIFFFARHYIAFNVFGALGFISLGVLYYKNVSFVIAKRLLRETNVVVILVLGLCNFSIDVVRPAHSLSPANGLMYALIVSAIVSLDAVKVKSRMFVMVVGILFVVGTVREIYDNIFGDSNQGVVLFEYTVQGNYHTFMKRSTKRAIYIQIMLFSMNGIYTLFKDRKQELMVFATGNIYRETGTASKEVEDKQHSRKIRLERTASLQLTLTV